LLPGCSFAPRYPQRIAICRRTVLQPSFPALGHMAACFVVTGEIGPPT
jgi:hypothetical protein